MRKLTLLVGIMLASSYSFADVNIKSLGAVWKNQQNVQVKQNNNDLTIVYGGADVSRRPTLVPHYTTA